MKKRGVIIALLGFVAIILGVIFSQRAAVEKPTVPPTPRVAAPPPRIILVPDEPTGVIFSYLGEDAIFPASLPVYQYSWSQNDAARISGAFGFSSPPIKKTVGSQSITIWSTDSEELSSYYDGKINNWSYVSRSPNQVLPKASSPVAVKAFVEQLLSFPQVGAFVFTEDASGPFDGFVTNDTPPPTLRGYNFSFLVGGSFPLVEQSFSETVVSAIVDQNNTIRAFSFSSLPTVSSDSPAARAILTVPDAINSLNKGLGVLVSASAADSDVFWGENPAFQSVQLMGVKIIYYANDTSGLLTPFFFFVGKASSVEGKLLNVEYVVSAIE